MHDVLSFPFAFSWDSLPPLTVLCRPLGGLLMVLGLLLVALSFLRFPLLFMLLWLANSLLNLFTAFCHPKIARRLTVF